MADNIDILEKVKSLGLNSYEAKVYLALFERESLSVNEIAKISNVPRARVYDTLDSLMNEGLASMKPGRLKKYSAAAPELLQEKLEHKIETQYKTQKETLASTVLTLKRTYEARRENGFDDSNPLDFIEVVKNPVQIHRKFIELYSKAQKEVLSFNKAPYTCTTEERINEQQQVFFDAIYRGVTQRTIIEMPPQDEAIAYFDKIRSGFREDYNCTELDGVKIVDELPIKLFIFDRKICMFTLEDPIKTRTSLTMLVTEHEAMAKCFLYLYEAYWKNGREYFIINNKKYYFSDEPDKWDWDTKGGE